MNDNDFQHNPFYGSRRIRDELCGMGYKEGRGHVITLMKKMGIEALYRKPRLSKPNSDHKVYPYLLRGLEISRANQVWAADITYIPMAKGFCYLVAIMDWTSRLVLSWRLSNMLDTLFCTEALEEALEKFGNPKIFNTDQGSQFTSEAFTEKLITQGISISMDGRGRWIQEHQMLFTAVRCLRSGWCMNRQLITYKSLLPVQTNPATSSLSSNNNPKTVYEKKISEIIEDIT